MQVVFSSVQSGESKRLVFLDSKGEIRDRNRKFSNWTQFSNWLFNRSLRQGSGEEVSQLHGILFIMFLCRRVETLNTQYPSKFWLHTNLSLFHKKKVFQLPFNFVRFSQTLGSQSWLLSCCFYKMVEHISWKGCWRKSRKWQPDVMASFSHYRPPATTNYRRICRYASTNVNAKRTWCDLMRCGDNEVYSSPPPLPFPHFST
jgi:hypothetical protein